MAAATADAVIVDVRVTPLAPPAPGDTSDERGGADRELGREMDERGDCVCAAGGGGSDDGRRCSPRGGTLPEAGTISDGLRADDTSTEGRR
jgi:hypothetical protein